MPNERFWRHAGLCRAAARVPVTRGAAKRALTRICGKVDGPILVNAALADRPVELDLSRGMDRTIYLFGCADPRGVRLIERVMARLDCRTAWDVGANRGNHAAFIRRWCRKLDAFEPHPEERARLSALFAGDADVRVLDVGLSDQCGILPFQLEQAGTGVSTFEIGGGGANSTASVRRGDLLAADLGVADLDFIKIDVEGHESRVLVGLAGVIAAQRPVIVMEVLASSSQCAASLSALLPGYRLYGNRTSLWSGLMQSAYDLAPFVEGRTHMAMVCVPEEKHALLAGLTPT